MHIIADNKIPYLQGLFEPFVDIEYLPAKDITAERVKECDGLIIRTRTKCDCSLLSGSKVKIIASATIGLDHVDLDYCSSNNIEVANSAGCNATAVVQYVLEVMAKLDFQPAQHTIGIVGYGNIGSLLAESCRNFGFNVLITDPFKNLNKGGCSLEYLLSNSDLVTIHVPLTHNGEHKTELLASDYFFNNLKNGG